MKKLVAMLLIAVLLAGSVFAAKAKEAPKTTTESIEITTITKELSEANYPGVLTTGSITGTDIFISDLSLFSNSALIENIGGIVYVASALKTDLGEFALFTMPAIEPSLIGINLYPINDLNDIFGLAYSTNIGDMPVGAMVQYGTERSNYESLELTGTPPQIESHAIQYLSARIGTSIKSGMPLDLSLGALFFNNIDTYEYYTTTSPNTWSETRIYDQSKLAIDLAARLGLGNGFTTFAQLSWLTGRNDYHDSVPGNDTDSILDNSKLSLQALIGKDVKLGETLLLKAATGFNVTGDNNPVHYVTHNLLSGKAMYTAFTYDQSSSFTIPINVALEGKLNDTWSFNTGWNYTLLTLSGSSNGANIANNSLNLKLRQYDATSSQFVDPSITWGIGTTAKIGDLRLDTYVKPDILTSGPYFLSRVTIASLTGGFSLLYNWK
jgi:hypothetical protein